MNNKICKLLSNKNIICSNNAGVTCPIRISLLSKYDKIKMLTVSILEEINSECILFKNRDSFEKLLLLMDLNGIINIYFKKKLPECIDINAFHNNYDFTEYIADKNFTVFFPKQNLNTIYYYYTEINLRTKLKTQILKLLVEYKLYNVLCLFFSNNKSMVIQRRK